MKFRTPEGATPIDDTDGLIPKHITMLRDLSAVEAENILLATSKHLARRKSAAAEWLSEDFLRRVHRDMFSRVWRWAGKYRQVELTIGVPTGRVVDEIGKLVADFKFWHAAESIPPLECAVRLHHRLAWIHPFKNGNGRHARMLADIYMHSQRLALPEWPTDLTAPGKSREVYVAALRAADRGNYADLLAYTRRLQAD